MITEEMILKAYQDTAQETVKLLTLEKKHQELAQSIVKCRQNLAEKKSKLADFHREISGPLLPVLDPKTA